jgi:hypothetical protein
MKTYLKTYKTNIWFTGFCCRCLYHRISDDSIFRFISVWMSGLWPFSPDFQFSNAYVIVFSFISSEDNPNLFSFHIMKGDFIQIVSWKYAGCETWFWASFQFFPSWYWTFSSTLFSDHIVVNINRNFIRSLFAAEIYSEPIVIMFRINTKLVITRNKIIEYSAVYCLPQRSRWMSETCAWLWITLSLTFAA